MRNITSQPLYLQAFLCCTFPKKSATEVQHVQQTKHAKNPHKPVNHGLFFMLRIKPKVQHFSCCRPKLIAYDP